MKTEDISDTRHIYTPERFVFDNYRRFRGAYQNLPEYIKLVNICMRDTHYIDSSALGMLLLLKKYAKENGFKMQITECNDNILNILKFANLAEELNVKY